MTGSHPIFVPDFCGVFKTRFESIPWSNDLRPDGTGVSFAESALSYVLEAGSGAAPSSRLLEFEPGRAAKTMRACLCHAVLSGV